MSSMFASITLRLAGRAAALSLLVALAVFASALPAAAQINPFGKEGGNLTKEDWTEINAARDKVLAEPAAVGTKRSWSNPKSGNSGTIAIAGIVKHGDMECRSVKYVLHIKAQNRNATLSRKECKTADGTWKYL